jgi:hypothetical protein
MAALIRVLCWPASAHKPGSREFNARFPAGRSKQTPPDHKLVWGIERQVSLGPHLSSISGLKALSVGAST